MNIHPVADLFPMLTEDELNTLAEDIKENGLRNPIVTYEGQVLDGRNRLKACELAGVEPLFVEYQGDDPIAFIVSLNLNRRHLEAGQRAAIGVQLLPPLEEESARRRAEGLAYGNTVRWGHAEAPGRLNGVAPDPANWSAARAGAMVGVSRKSINDAKRLHEQAPELFAEVKSGGISLNRGVMILQQRQLGLLGRNIGPRRTYTPLEEQERPAPQGEDVATIPAYQVADAVGTLNRYARRAREGVVWIMPETVEGRDGLKAMLDEFFERTVPQVQKYADSINQ